MQQRATVSSQPVEQTEDSTTVKSLSRPIELTEAELLQVMGGLGPNGNWSDLTTAGPNGNW